MRKIVAGLFISLDGVVEAPDSWIGPYFNDEVGQHVGSLIAAGDTLLLGRVTYQGFAESFGGQSGGMADTMNNFPKVVVSTTLDRADWQNSTLVSSKRRRRDHQAEGAAGPEHQRQRQRHSGRLAAAPGPAGRTQPARVPRRGGPRQAPVRGQG